MEASAIHLAATTLFALAVLHVFLVKRFQHLASRYPEGSLLENCFHLLGEVEVVFGLWAGLLVAFIGVNGGAKAAIEYVEGLNFTEPMFVFVVMAIAATRPVTDAAESLIGAVARLLPFGRNGSYLLTAVTVGPLLGSVITEPAAMTVTALLLKRRFFDGPLSFRAKYAILAVLFVNISIGGVLTPFAAPPVLMVARPWGWDLPFMMRNFGWKATLAVLVNGAALTLLLRRLLQKIPESRGESNVGPSVPFWLKLLHLAFLAVVVVTAHHPAFFVPVFLFFLGVVTISNEYQEELKLKESLLVAFFLGGLVVLGSLQGWWLKPLITSLEPLALFLGATALTAFLDNAALTYLGTQVPSLAETMKYALVAGAVCGGGLTVIANAPNPAGFSILRPCFGSEGISPILLLGYALAPTVVALIFLWGLP